MPLEGIDAASKFMRPLMLRMQVISNNLANVDSIGFKRGKLFVELLNEGEPTIQQYDTGLGEYLPGTKVTEVPDFTQGELQQTSNSFDFAVDGPGFFVVETPDGIRYSRAGNFVVSPEGELKTKNGYTVLGQNDNAITFPNFTNLKKEDIAVTPLGEIFVQRIYIGQLKIVGFESQEQLKKVGASLFMPREDVEPIPIEPDKVFVRQGFLEGSNVDGIEEMVEMIELMHQFETGQRLIQTQDESVSRSLEVGRFSS
jgi:flagellar basal body rod protein FlgG